MSDATKARDAALAQVAEHTEQAWKFFACNAVYNMGGEFTADDVWAKLEEMGVAPPHEPRALAPVLIRMAKVGVIEPTDQYRQSRRGSRHAGPVRVWRRVSQGRLF